MTSIFENNRKKLFSNPQKIIIQSRQNNYLSEEMYVKSHPKSLTSKNNYKDLINNYLKSKKNYNKLYPKGRRRNSSPTYLKKIYMINQKKLGNYFKKNKYDEGLKLEGNKSYEDISIENYINEIDSYINHIEQKLKENNLYYLYPEEDDLISERLKLSPIPSKSRILMKSDKEIQDLSSAERSAVMLRRFEYTHGFPKKNFKNDFRILLKNKRQRIFIFLNEAALTIQRWWKQILQNRNDINGNVNNNIRNNYSNNNFTFKHNINGNFDDRNLNLAKIFFKQIEVFYYMKRNKKRRKNIFFYFIGQLRALTRKKLKKNFNPESNFNIRNDEKEFKNKYNNYNKNNNNIDYNNYNTSNSNNYYSPGKEREIAYSNEIRNNFKIKSPKNNMKDNHNYRPILKEENINRMILENGATIIIGREDKKIKKNKIKLIETSNNTSKINKNKTKKYIYDSPNNNEIRSIFGSPLDNHSERFKRKIGNSNSIQKDKEKDMEKKYRYLLEKSKSGNKKINDNHYYLNPNYNYCYNSEGNDDIKPYSFRNNNPLLNNFPIYNDENNLILKDRKEGNINKKNEKEINMYYSDEDKPNNHSLTNELDNEEEEFPIQFPKENYPQELYKYKSINETKKNKNNNKKENNINDNNSINSSLIKNSISSSNSRNKFNRSSFDENKKKKSSKNMNNPQNEEEISKNSEATMNKILKKRKGDIQNYGNYKNNIISKKSLNKVNKNNFNNNNNKINIKANNYNYNTYDIRDNRNKNLNNSLNSSKNSSKKSFNQSISLKNDNSNNNILNNSKNSINNKNNLINLNDGKANKINSMNNKSRYQRISNVIKNNIKNDKKQNIKKKEEPEIDSKKKNNNENKEKEKKILLNNNIISDENKTKYPKKSMKINAEEDETIPNHLNNVNFLNKIKNKPNISETEDAIEVSDEYGIINLTNEMNAKNNQIKKNNKNTKLINLHQSDKKIFKDEDNISEQDNNNNNNIYYNKINNNNNKKNKNHSKNNIDNSFVETEDLQKKNISNFEELQLKKKEGNDLNKRDKNNLIKISNDSKFIKNNIEDSNYTSSENNILNKSKKINIKAEPENIPTIRKLLHSYDGRSFSRSKSKKENNSDNELNSVKFENRKKLAFPNTISYKKMNQSYNDIYKYKFSKNKLRLTNSSSLSYIHNRNSNSLSTEVKIEKFIYFINLFHKQEFFSRLVLNYLHKNKVNLNDQELICLLKLGKSNTYQRILNNSLKLNLTKDDYDNKDISFKDWVKKFVKNKNEEENKNNKIKNKYKMFFNVTKILKKEKKDSEEDEKDILDIPKKEFNLSNNFIDSYIDNKKKTIRKIKILNESNKKFSNSLDENYDSDLFFYKNFKNKKLNNFNTRNKRDTSKDIIIPKNLNQAYNLIRCKKKKYDSEFLREFNDERDNF